MVDLLLVAVVFLVLGAPFLAGTSAVYWNAARQSGITAIQTPAGASVYRRGVELAKVPALLLFLPLALTSVVVQVTIGYGGGPPPLPIMVGRITGVILGLAVYVGGLTIAGSVLAVYVRAGRTGTGE